MSGEETTTVLVVDDDVDVADSYATHLREQFDVETVYSGQAALDALSPSIDVVLLDRRMPDISGDDVLDEIRNRSLTARVAMVTAVDPDFDIIEMPFDDYVAKPVSSADLVETVERLCRCADYHETVREFYARSAKYAALQTSKPPMVLEENEEFAALEAELTDVRAQIAEITTEFDNDDFQALFKDIGLRDSLDTDRT